MSAGDSLAPWMAAADARDSRDAERMLAGLRRRMFARAEAELGFARYRDVVEIGRGGMGVVYRAWDPALRRTVAIKVLRGEARTGPDRLAAEARAMATVSDPNVVAVLDVGVHDGQAFVVMEHVAGTDLGRWLAARAHPWAEIVDVFVAAGRGLAAAHARGLVHRDFKPSNVLVGDDGRVCVTDFGLAASMRMVSEPNDAGTASTTPVGTPRYMAPEQAAGRVVDARADQWAFAASLHEALLGEHPRGRGRANHAPAVPAAPRTIVRVLARALADDPDARHRDMGELLAALRRAPRRRARTALLATATAATIAAFAWPRTAVDRCADAGATALWDRASQADMAAAFAAAAPYGEHAWSSFAAGVSPWLDDWRAADRRACAADDARARSCLARQHDALAGLLALYAAPDAAMVARAGGAAAVLPEVGTCNDDADLGDAARARSIARHDAWMADVRARAAAGRWREAASLAEDARTAARTDDLPLAGIDAGIELGLAHARLGQFDAAEAALRAAYFAADDRDLGELAARAAAGLVMVDSSRGRLDEATAWARHASGWLARAEPSTAVAIEVEIAIADHEIDRVDGAAALPHLERAWALTGRDETSPSAPRIWNEMGVAHLTDGDDAGAEPCLRRALAIGRAQFGDLHPQLAHAYANLGTVAWRLGDTAEAERSYREAHRIRMATAPDTPATVTTCINVAIAVSGRGAHAEAKALLADCEAMAERVLEPFDARRSLLAQTFATELLELGESAAALARFQQAVEIERRIHGPDHARVGAALHGVADALLAMDRLDEAVTAYGETIALLEPDGPPLDVASAWRGLGLAEDRRLHDDAAWTAVTRAAETARELLPIDHDERLAFELAVAEVGVHTSHWDPAIAAAERVRGRGPSPVRRALASFYLAQAAWATTRDRPRVAALLDEARAILAGAQGLATVESNRAAVERWAATQGIARDSVSVSEHSP